MHHCDALCSQTWQYSPHEFLTDGVADEKTDVYAYGACSAILFSRILTTLTPRKYFDVVHVRKHVFCVS